MTKENIIRKLTSRKFWAAIAGFVTGLLIYLGRDENETSQIAALIMSGASVIAYMLAEGWADAGSAGTLVQYVQESKPPED